MKQLVLDRDLNAQIEANSKQAWEESHNAGKESDKDLEEIGIREKTKSRELSAN